VNPLLSVFELVGTIVRFTVNVSLWSYLVQAGTSLDKLESYIGALIFTMPFVSLVICKLLREDAYHIKTRIWLFTLVLPIVFVPLRFLVSQIYWFVLNNPVNPRQRSITTTNFLTYCVVQLIIMIFAFILTVRGIKRVEYHTYFLPPKLLISHNEGVEEYGQLRVIASRLVTLMRVTPPEIFVFKLENPVVFTVDEGKKKPLIVVSTGLLELLDDDELAACLGHELPHIINRDSLVRKAASFLRAVMFYNPFGYLIELEIYREREFLADILCSRVTKKPEALASALIKIAENTTNPDPLPERRNVLCLFRNYRFWFRKHPPLEERLRRLIRLAESREFL